MMAKNASVLQGIGNLSPDANTLSQAHAKPSLKMFLRILRTSRRSRALLPLLSFFALVGCGLQVYAPYFVRRTIDLMTQPGGIVIGADRPILAGLDIRLITRHLVLLVVMYTLSFVMLWLMNTMAAYIAASVASSLRKQLYEKSDRLPIGFFDRARDGELETRFVYDIDAISEGMLQGLVQLFSLIIIIAGTLGFMIALSARMTIIIIPLAVLTVVIATQLARRTSHQFSRQQALVGELNTLSDEAFTGQREIKLFNHEEAIETRFNTLSEDLFRVAQKAQFYSSLPNPTTRFMNHLVYILIATVGILFGGLSVGQISAFILYWNNFSKPINDFTNVTAQIMAAFASAERVYSIIDMPDAPGHESRALAQDSISETGVGEQWIEGAFGHVIFEHISFSYVPENPLITDVSLEVMPGQTVAVVGPTGAGKTTLINLLLRFYDIQSGVIRIDGQDTMQMNKIILRRKFGMVLQDTWLFSGTIRDNIKFGRPESTDDAMIEASKAAHAHGFIRRLPAGYDTIIEGSGAGISQGQKQLLAIARVMLTNPSILILDEATSSVDSLTEHRVRDAFDKLMRGRTSFVIAHRLSTIRNADMILVMQNGNIVENGMHEQLIQKRGLYAAMNGLETMKGPIT